MKVPAMQYHCFDSTYRVLFHPTGEQTSRLAGEGGLCSYGRNQGAATQRRFYLPILYGKGCTYSERKASIVQPIELADL